MAETFTQLVQDSPERFFPLSKQLTIFKVVVAASTGISERPLGAETLCDLNWMYSKSEKMLSIVLSHCDFGIAYSTSTPSLA